MGRTHRCGGELSGLLSSAVYRLDVLLIPLLSLILLQMDSSSPMSVSLLAKVTYLRMPA